MDKNLARYLFFNEVLYRPDEVQEQFEEQLQEKLEAENLPNFSSSTLIFSSVFSENEKQFLGNILKAIKLTYDDVQIITQLIDFQKIVKTKMVTKIIIFGFKATDLGLPSFYSNYQIYANEGIQILVSEKLPHIQANLRDEKRSLWNALQQLFL